MSAIGTKASPIHPTALAAFAAALLAIVLAFYGSVAAEVQIAGSPLNAARGGPGLESVRTNAARYAIQFVAFVLPFLLGLGAAIAGATGMRRIEQAEGRYRGDALAVFAILIGGFAAVIGGCMMLAVFVWPHMPSLYTV